MSVLLRIGNVSLGDFAALVGAEFTDDERAHLMASRSGKAELTNAEDWHIFDAPALVITVGAADSRTAAIFVAADQRRRFEKAVSVFLDARHLAAPAGGGA